MSDPTPPENTGGQDSPGYSEALKGLGEAIARHPRRPEAAFCGMRLYVEAIGSGKVTQREFLLDGRAPTGEEPEGTIKIPMLAIAGRIVLGFDPTLGPDEFRLVP